jgi:hypothetical protein
MDLASKNDTSDLVDSALHIDTSDLKDEQVQVLGLDKSREDFCAMLACLAAQDANQLVVARLMHEVMEM